MYEDRVARGIALLDRVAPGWEEHIDPNKLKIGSIQSCILGQLYGDYYIGLARVFKNRTLAIDSRAEHGFTLGIDDILAATSIRVERYCDYLADAWRDAIRARAAARTLKEDIHV